MQHTKRGRARLGVAGAILAVALGLGSAPYLYGMANCPPGARFWAVPPVNSSDANQYLAFARRVSEGQWLLGDPFTSELHTPRLFLPHALFDGMFCRLLGGDPLAAFHVSRGLFGALLLLAGAWLGGLVLPRWRQQLLFLVLLGFSAGAGWWVDRFARAVPHGDYLQPEGNTLYLLGNLPHLALSAALLTALFCTLLAYERDRRKRWLAITAGLAHLLAWVHPFDFVVLGLSLALYGSLRWAASRTPPRASLFHAVALVVGALPAAVYLLWIIRTDPIYARLASDVLQVQNFPFYAIAHGLLVFPALFVPFQRHLRSRCLLPLCWVLCAFGFLLTPFRMGGKQPRMVGGVHAPLALLAAAGLDSLARRASPVRRRRRRSSGPLTASTRSPRTSGALAPALFAGGYVALAATGAWGIVRRHAVAYAPAGPDYYHSPAMQGLFPELARQGSAQQVTLGGPWTGGWAPVLADTRVYDGHWHMTLNRPRKRAERDWFFTSRAAPQAKSAWLRTRGITWVIACPWEWRGGAAPLDGVPGLQPVYVTPEVTLYRFTPTALSWPGQAPLGVRPPHDPRSPSDAQM